MSAPGRIVGLAIVSEDGMIADRTGIQPDILKPEADQVFFHSTLDEADALVHGRNSGEGGSRAPERRRIVLTRQVADVAPIPGNSLAVHWNPQGALLDDAWKALGLSGGTLAVIGGTEPFGLFLRRGYDVFHLTRLAGVRLPSGRPVFPGVPAHSPDTMLSRYGLRPGPARVLDTAGLLTLTTWHRG